eukprot:CAMPEP_0194150710 /NCGR_PEP_ID=MMETSP0152-20130528/44826_1 /TAXON_ID=1049557 /ORGANISM="Thalassiothrix antarctica, Strain L6-D1" /LENGTH=78 /DNA_ID=CAMNT_0038853907 /DNA_START=73 /DNA_END=309 /DNA_ORIENTATION=-
MKALLLLLVLYMSETIAIEALNNLRSNEKKRFEDSLDTSEMEVPTLVTRASGRLLLRIPADSEEEWEYIYEDEESENS